MKYFGMPMGMWMLFSASFTEQMSATLHFDAETAKKIKRQAKPKYQEIITNLPEFERGDRFKMNIVNAAMLAAFYLNMPQKPSVEEMTDFYAKAMMTKPMLWFCKQSGKNKFTPNDLKEMEEIEALRAADRNPYSWNMQYLPYPDGSGYEARFERCGICALMRELRIYELTPAMCHLDYTMAEAGGTSDFVREYTLASGGPYCDCGYKKKKQA
ncbi:MAG: L-2-amino-thiazoline-4-carboxylic acid hydrolase [Bacteroidales bacterium]|nr:L-2-amino-thiazoline-4-carboxylic acid hydrolase [Bacteroidales bacterium]MCM1416909.1 L-2-amino-thiazoline-4-carboxylic acid hydrolase [bacterium]MCM1424474.1 L-2-amino-thiazoline-4-carboxylic acid hydrolase [bacterium]